MYNTRITHVTPRAYTTCVQYTYNPRDTTCIYHVCTIHV